MKNPRLQEVLPSLTPVCESLLRWTEENKLVPVLLTKVPTFESDGVTLKCELKPNVKFHDGSKLTAKDVKYTFELCLPPRLVQSLPICMTSSRVLPRCSLARRDRELEGLTIQDDTHFTFTLSSPMVAFVSNLGISYGHIFPKDACEKAAEKWGTGTNLIRYG